MQGISLFHEQDHFQLTFKDFDAIESLIQSKLWETISNEDFHKIRIMGVSSSVEVTGKRIAVLFRGPASGGHNVVLGIKAGNTLLGVKADLRDC